MGRWHYSLKFSLRVCRDFLVGEKEFLIPYTVFYVSLFWYGCLWIKAEETNL